MSFPRYPAYKDSGVEWLGDVPSHWDVKPLGFFCKKIGSGKTPSGGAETYVTEGVVFLRSQNVHDEGLSLDDVAFISAETDEELRASRVQSGDVLLNITGASIGRTCLVPRGLAQANVNQHVCIIRLADPQSRAFASQFLKSSWARAQIDAAQTGAARDGLNFAQISKLLLTVPPVSEQEVIAAFLDRETAKIDKLVAEQRRLMELLKEKRQAVISHAVTKGLNPSVALRPSGIEWLGDVPAHWDVASLTRVAERVVVGIAEAATHAYADDGVPILRSTNIRAGRIIGEILFVDPAYASGRDSKQISAGDLITVRTGNAGVTAVIPQALDGCQCFTMLITTLQLGSVAEYYCYWMNSKPAQCYFTLEGWGTAQVNISVPILKALPIPIPPTSEQKEIILFLDHEVGKLDTLIDEAQRAIDLLRERRTALISAAVTGQIDVRLHFKTGAA